MINCDMNLHLELISIGELGQKTAFREPKAPLSSCQISNIDKLLSENILVLLI